MPIVIEDGSGSNADANSYASRAEVIAYAALRGQTLTDDALLDAALIRAMDYLEGQSWQGDRVSDDQPLSWPRRYVWLHGVERLSTDLPRELLYGQMALAIEAITQDLQPNPTGKGSVIEETVQGAVTVRYSEAKPAMTTAWSKAQAILQPLLSRGGMFLVRS